MSDTAALRIGEVAMRTGVTVATLRAWERRYALLEPERTNGGHRLYSERDVARVRQVSRLIEEGWSAAAAARHVRRNANAPVLSTATADSDVIDAFVDRLRRAIDGLDSASVDAAFDEILARIDVPRAIDEVILPVLHTLGDGWETDPCVVAREHFATHAVRARLQRLLRAASNDGGRTCVAAAPENEEHDLGLLCGAVIAAEAGWRVYYLGPRTPTTALLEAVLELRPQVVLLGAVFREHALELLSDEPDLRPAGVVLGGPGFAPEDLVRLGTGRYHDAPMSELPETMRRSMDDSMGASGLP